MAYMAPEQFEPGGADHRSDLWAVGIMLYELLTGHHPVQPLSQEALLRHAYFPDEPYPRIRDELPDLPHRLADVVDRCLEKRKERRVASAAELLGRARAAAAGTERPRDRRRRGPLPGPGRVSGERRRSLLRPRRRRAAGDDPPARSPDRSSRRRLRRRQVVVRPRRRRARAARLGGELGGAGHPAGARAAPEPRELLLPLVDRRQWRASPTHTRERSQTLRESPGELGAVLRARAAERQPAGACCSSISSRSSTRWSPTKASGARSPPACRARPTTPPRRCACSSRCAPTSSIAWARIAGSSTIWCAACTSSSRCREMRCARRSRRRSPSSATASRATRCWPRWSTRWRRRRDRCPLLQFAGAKLWEARDERRKVLTAESYRQMGGISGVLAQHADRVVAALPPDLRAVGARRLPASGDRRRNARHRRRRRARELDRRSGRGARAGRAPRSGAPGGRAEPRRRGRAPPSSWSTNR